MLQIGDKVVYPMHGAGVISGIENCEVLGEGKSYYVLKMPMGNMKVMIPTDNADHIGLRDIIPKGEVDKVRDVLGAKPERPQGSWNKRFHANLDRMKSGDICDVAAVARNLILQDRRHRVSSGERRLMDLAKQILVSELVFACDKSPQEVESWMDTVLSHNAYAS
ncbi:CarD family transcriptional regulator [uncultured Mitsuokella sp.]|uniref:CarD family transcriptional regulator n=1 Tax=uncultured Mitsuokella sp. TaxID=453120 RepID=UPI0026DAA96C|nr:CarD family transcriptional regulator [uncultured Mitsuokella sp.]